MGKYERERWDKIIQGQDESNRPCQTCVHASTRVLAALAGVLTLAAVAANEHVVLLDHRWRHYLAPE